jgi:hypothetical protein
MLDATWSHRLPAGETENQAFRETQVSSHTKLGVWRKNNKDKKFPDCTVYLQIINNASFKTTASKWGFIYILSNLFFDNLVTFTRVPNNCEDITSRIPEAGYKMETTLVLAANLQCSHCNPHGEHKEKARIVTRNSVTVNVEILPQVQVA